MGLPDITDGKKIVSFGMNLAFFIALCKTG